MIKIFLPSLLFVLLSAQLLSIAPVAVVHDPAAFAQKSADFIKELKHWADQANEFKQEAERFKQQVASLGHLQWKDILKLNGYIDSLERFEADVRNRTRKYRSSSDEFEKIYGDNFKVPYWKREKLWQEQTKNSINDAMRVHGFSGNSSNQIKELRSAIDNLKTADGEVKSIQALGQILGIQATQINELKNIIQADSSLKQKLASEKLASERHEGHSTKKFFSPLKTSTKPKPKIFTIPKLGERVK